MVDSFYKEEVIPKLKNSNRFFRNLSKTGTYSSGHTFKDDNKLDSSFSLYPITTKNTVEK